MPLNYPPEFTHRRSSSTPMPDNMDMPPLDVDDSIVLSDLLRTGEASRLRRRGAMRIDHNHPHHTSSGGHLLPGPPRISSPNIVLVERSNWDSDSDLESPSFTTYWNVDQPNRFARRHPHTSRRFGPYRGSGVAFGSQGVKDEYVYSLVCGSEVADCASDHVEPFTPSILPLYPPLSPSALTKTNTSKSNTGCGTIVHPHAAPKSKFRMWTARTPASETVMPLDACYFDEKDASRFMKSQCGCVSEGVGCAVCGNLLGTRYTPCKLASEGFFCPRLLDKQPSASIPTPPQNDGPHPKTPHSKPDCVYTFFSDAVTSTPAFSFPLPPVRPVRSRSIESRPVSPPTSPPFVTPERYMYSPYDEEESDSENYPPFIADNSTGWGWRPISSPIFPSLLDPNSSTVLPNAPVSLPPPSVSLGSSGPWDDMLLDRFVDTPPVPLPDDHQPASQQPWGISPPSRTLPLRTRTGRTARWSSIGRSFPSLSSGLGGTMHDDRPISPLSFYDRQLMAASERETRDGRLGDVVMTGSTNDNLASASISSALDLDGETVSWGSTASDPGTDLNSRYVYDADGEYKPADYDFDR